MSKHNKYKNNYTPKEKETTETVETVENLGINEEIEEVSVNTSDDLYTSDSLEVSEEVVTDTYAEIDPEVLNNEEQIYVDDVVTELPKEFVFEEDVVSEESEVVETVEHIEVETSIPTKTEVKPVSLYKVGTDLVNDKCINQVLLTTDLELAKVECEKARDTHKTAYFVFDKTGYVVYSAVYSAPKDNYYRVGIDWKGGVCINQVLSTIDFNQACNTANENTKLTGIIHHVFDPTGKVVFSSKKKLILLSYKKRGNKDANWYT